MYNMTEIRKKLWTIILQNGPNFINIHRDYYQYRIVVRCHDLLYVTTDYIIIKPPKEEFFKEKFENILIRIMKDYIESDLSKLDKWISNNYGLIIPINNNLIKTLFEGGYNI